MHVANLFGAVMLNVLRKALKKNNELGAKLCARAIRVHLWLHVSGRKEHAYARHYHRVERRRTEKKNGSGSGQT